MRIFNPIKMLISFLKRFWARGFAQNTHEILGSSSGEPNQVYRISRAAILKGLTIQVQEHLEQAEREDKNTVWITWQEVDTLSGSGADDRVYIVTGDTEIRFGDGKHGKKLPAGRNNVRASYEH